MELARIWNTVKGEGVRDTLSILTIQQILKMHENRNGRYDKKHGIDTHGLLNTDQQEFKGENKGNAVYYYASNINIFNSILSYFKRLKVRFEDFTFIDLGCGKGRTLFMASVCPFREIVGVEASIETTAVARENIIKFKSRSQRCKSISVINDDIFNYSYPKGNLIVYMSNPFIPNSQLYENLLVILEKLSAEGNRKIYVVYYCPEAMKVFENFTFLKKVHHYVSIFDSHDWVLYEN